jgi:hypothetical protein
MVTKQGQNCHDATRAHACAVHGWLLAVLVAYQGACMQHTRSEFRKVLATCQAKKPNCPYTDSRVTRNHASLASLAWEITGHTRVTHALFEVTHHDGPQIPDANRVRMQHACIRYAPPLTLHAKC